MTDQRKTTHARVYPETQEGATAVASLLGITAADVYEIAFKGQFGDLYQTLKQSRGTAIEQLRDMGLLDTDEETDIGAVA